MAVIAAPHPNQILPANDPVAMIRALVNVLRRMADAINTIPREVTGIKRTDTQDPPGVNVGLLRWELGSTAGTLKLVAYAGTDGTGITIVDNVGSGNG